MSRQLRRFTAATLLALTLPILSNCYGRFPLTHGLYQWNSRIFPSHVERVNVAEQCMFWVFFIFQFYTLAIVGDLFIVNVVEFWAGKPVQPIACATPDGATVAIVPAADGQSLEMSVSRDGRTVSEGRLVRVSDQLLQVYDAQGQPAGAMEKTSEGIRFVNATGRVLAMIPARDLPAIP